MTPTDSDREETTCGNRVRWPELARLDWADIGVKGEGRMIICATRGKYRRVRLGIIHWRFGLRTIFVVLTFLSIPLGWLGCKFHEGRRQRAAVDSIYTLGGTVSYEDGQDDTWGSWLSGTVGEDFAVNVVAVDLSDTPVVDNMAVSLRDLPQIESLDLRNTELGDDALLQVQELRLFILLLGNTNVTDAGLAHIRRMRSLRTLWLDGTRITGAGLANIQSLSNLNSLNLAETRVCDPDLTHLTRISTLKYLDLRATRVTNAGMLHVARLGRLEWLDLQDTAVTDAGLAHLSKLKQLKSVLVHGTNVTQRGANELRNMLPSVIVYPIILQSKSVDDG